MDEEHVERGDRHREEKGKRGKRVEGKAKDRASRRRDKEAMEIDSAADIPENGVEEAVICIAEEKEGHGSKNEKGRIKEKKDKFDGSVDSGSTDHGVCKEQAKNSGLMAVKPSSDAEGKTSKHNVNKDKKNKEKKKRKEAATAGTTFRNLGSEYAETDKVASEQCSKSKKRKRKRMAGEPAADRSAGDQVVTREDNKRKQEHSVVFEESSQIDNTNTGDNRESKKKRGKKSNKVSSDLCKNVSAGGDEADVDGTNQKKEKKIKEIGGGKREKEKATQSKDKGKRVSFADAAEEFSIEGGDDEEGGSSGESKLVHGQWFTPEEDATLLEAMKNYAEMKQLGEKGLEMIGSCKKYPEVKGCWNDIAKSLPHRPKVAIYNRALKLIYRGDKHKWTEEEVEKIRRYVKENGPGGWTILAQELGKHPIHVKDTWRRIKPKNMKKGPWTQDEHQNLFDLVNLDLRMKACQEKSHGHRMLRENISWEAISDKLATRNHKNCCLKWYSTLASPLVKQGIWSDVDDYLLVEALQKDDAVCIEDVNWDSLLHHRSGEVCRKRWNHMVRGIGGHREKPFIEQVEVLSKRYCLDMANYRKNEKV